MEDIDKNRISSPLTYNDIYTSCIIEENVEDDNATSIPPSSLPANLGPLRASFEETTFEFEKVKREPPNNCFDASFKVANENYRAYSPRLLHENKHSEFLEGNGSREIVTCPIEASVARPPTTRLPLPSKPTPEKLPVLSTQVSFCQSPPIEHEYPPPLPRRHFSFGARTHSEQQRAQSHYNSRRNRFSRQKTTRLVIYIVQLYIYIYII